MRSKEEIQNEILKYTSTLETLERLSKTISADTSIHYIKGYIYALNWILEKELR